MRRLLAFCCLLLCGVALCQSPGPVDLVVSAVPESFVQRWNAPGGVLVQRVTPGSFAASLGIAPGDILAEVNRKPITGPESFQALAATLHGDVVFRIRRSASPGLLQFVGDTLPEGQSLSASIIPSPRAPVSAPSSPSSSSAPGDGLTAQQQSVEAEALRHLGGSVSAPPSPASGAGLEAQALDSLQQNTAHTQAEARRRQQEAEEQAQLLALNSPPPSAPPESRAAGILNGINAVLGASAASLQEANERQEAQLAQQAAQLQQITAIRQQQAEAEAARLRRQQQTASLGPPPAPPAPRPAAAGNSPSAPLAAGTLGPVSNGAAVCPASGHITRGHYASCDVFEGQDVGCTPGQRVSLSDGVPNAPGCTGSASGSAASVNSGSSAANGSRSPANTVAPDCMGVHGRWVANTLFPEAHEQDLWLDSTCPGDESILWFLGKSFGQMAFIHGAESGRAGNTLLPGRDSTLSIYVCPTHHPVPVQSNGDKVDGHNQRYSCAPGIPLGFIDPN